ncbi:hypothetical protein HD553DRAFT_302847 [Filobasidium floriforme]|uniref:uncharacterized protein n=1 Tax=Filobasidium floriforme TaxID=5210 RepID=UPI001E8E1629|nr:uncharacterized protein HD553DRAFT_302847 [Filobasidium floriforme]KAH8090608.1 hypothetical protein HD553DRAFT_302847 [Filobasidium floriforme]
MFPFVRRTGNSVRPARSISIVQVHMRNFSPSAARLAGEFVATRGNMQLHRIKEMLERIDRTNRPSEKIEVVKQYEDVRPVLELTYDPHVKYYVKSSSVIKHLARFPEDIERSSSRPVSSIFVPGDEEVSNHPTLESLLEALRKKEANIFDIISFMQKNGVFATARTVEDVQRANEVRGAQGLSALSVFLRVIDKDLNVGFGPKLFEHVGWTLQKDAERSLIAHAKRNGVELSDPPKEEPVFDMAMPDTMRLEPALGKTVLAEDVPKLFADPNGAQWYGSRKLDGVRCLVVVDVEIEESEYFESSNIKVTRAKCYSRTGKAFHVLQPLLDDIEKLCTNWTDLIRILESEPSLSENTYKYKYLSGIFSENKRFVLDGELCVLKESKDEEGVLVEDFKEVVGKVRRKTGSADDIRMFILDMIPWSNFDRHANKGTADMPAQQKSFSQRQEDVIAVLQRMDDITIEGEDHSLLWLLQEPMNSPEEVEGLIATASEEGWEGIVLRRDVRYEGKRTANIRKYKAWLDAEYEVKDIEINTMRLPVDGIYEDRPALASLIIEHKGVPVNVGSGFTNSQRIEFAKDPSLIIGKQVTVEYFGESTSDARDKKGGGLSLRFPRIKHIWEGEKRDV